LRSRTGVRRPAGASILSVAPEVRERILARNVARRVDRLEPEARSL
jgi:hypothetical protein